MAEPRQTVSGGSLPPVDPAQAAEALQATLGQGAGAGGTALTTFTSLQARRAARMTAVAGALGAVAGATHPDAVALQAQVQTIGSLQTAIATQVQRASRWPTPRPNEWLVYGTVTAADGTPAVGLRVRVFDKDRKYDDLLGDTETDDQGDWWATYHLRDFQEAGENNPDLYVMVTDASGAVVYSSRDSVRYEAGRSEYFDIHLGTPSVPAKRRKAPAAKPKTGRKTGS